MAQVFSDIAFTSAVKDQQTRLGSRASYARWEQKRGFAERITPELIDFIAERNSFYLGTASADGRPYIQHRGGPRGFLKVLDEHTLGFADLGGNRQYISLGNLSENDRCFIFLMDYEQQQRIKIWGRARVVEDDPELLETLTDPSAGGRVERAILFRVEAWDANCRQHIPRLGPAEDAAALSQLRARIVELEGEVRELREERGGPENARAVA